MALAQRQQRNSSKVLLRRSSATATHPITQEPSIQDIAIESRTPVPRRPPRNKNGAPPGRPDAKRASNGTKMIVISCNWSSFENQGGPRAAFLLESETPASGTSARAPSPGRSVFRSMPTPPAPRKRRRAAKKTRDRIDGQRPAGNHVVQINPNRSARHAENRALKNPQGKQHRGEESRRPVPQTTECSRGRRKSQQRPAIR